MIIFIIIIRILTEYRMHFVNISHKCTLHTLHTLNTADTSNEQTKPNVFEIESMKNELLTGTDDIFLMFYQMFWQMGSIAFSGTKVRWEG